MKHYLEFEKPIVELQRKLDDLRKNPSVSLEPEIAAIEAKLEETRKAIFSDLTPWQRVQLARHPRRPYSLDYFSTAFSGFTELHGDRLYSNDHAIVGGFAHLGDHKVMVIGTQKGRETKENIKRNFGSAHPEGYRKALRLMKMADKFGLPIVALIDTAGAYPGIGAEERHISEAIAVNLREMMVMEVPIIAAVIGEAGSGGAGIFKSQMKKSDRSGGRYAVILGDDEAQANEVTLKPMLGGGESFITYSNLVAGVRFNLPNIRGGERTIDIGDWSELDRAMIGGFLGYFESGQMRDFDWHDDGPYWFQVSM